MIGASLVLAAALAAFLYLREGDAEAAEEITRIEIAGAPAGPSIDPRLFSNFLEHLGGTIYEGLWANVVYNPQLEPDQQGRLARWSRNEKADWLQEAMTGRGLRLREGGEARQLLTLPAHRERRYQGSLWARAHGSDASVLSVSFSRPEKPPLIARTSIEIKGAFWAKHNFSITIPARAIDRAESVLLTLTAARGGCDLENVELFPADQVEGVDPDVLKAAKDLRIELLRWPGGNFASGYHWKEGIGPRHLRRTVPNPAWGGLETHHFGTDEFMRFCRRIGAKPMICVNAGNGTPEEAADWVEYCNGAPNTPMGRLRAQNGSRQPYDVRVWEIGNELYGEWQIGHTDAKGNAERFVRFRKAMLAKDPTIEIVATGRGDGFVGAGLESVRIWNQEVLEAAKRDGRAPEYLSLHPLVPLPADLSRFSYEEVYDSAMAHPHWWSEQFVPSLQNQVYALFGHNAPTKAAVTEWGIIVGGPQWLRYPNHDTQSGAVYAALFFHAMMRRADFVTLANVTALMHGGGIKRPGSVVYVDPMYHVERMYGAARPERAIPVRVTGPTYDVPRRGFLPAGARVPYLDAFAAESRGESLLFVVNRDRERARRAEIAIPVESGPVRIETLSAAPTDTNSLLEPRKVAPVTSRAAIRQGKLTHDFPRCSVTVLRW